jgi:carboxymethylenebutenolidase
MPTLDTADGPMEVYEVEPDGAPRGAVIVVEEAFGLNEHIRDVARRVAAAGYHTVAPELFHRSGVAPVEDYTNFGPVRELMAGTTDDTILADLDVVLAHLQAAGFAPGKVGIVGFCFGGRATFLASARRPLGAGVGFYGGGIAQQGGLPFPPLADEATTLQAPWLGLFGDEDASIPVEGVEELRERLKGAPVPAEVVRYADAGHGFHCDARDSYHEDSAKDGWARALSWFAEHIG